MAIKFKKITSVEEYAPKEDDSVFYLASVNNNLKRISAQTNKSNTEKLVWNLSDPFKLNDQDCLFLTLKYIGDNIDNYVIEEEYDKNTWPPSSDINDMIKAIEQGVVLVVSNDFFAKIKEKILQCNLDFSMLVTYEKALDNNDVITLSKEFKYPDVDLVFLANSHWDSDSSEPQEGPEGFECILCQDYYEGNYLEFYVLKKNDYDKIKILDSPSNGRIYWHDIISIFEIIRRD